MCNLEDYLNPDWSDDFEVHNWKNYTTEDLKKEWGNFTDNQKIIIGQALQEVSRGEEWD